MIGEQYTTPGSSFGSGLSFYDFNQDGWDDLTIGRGHDAPVFFVNLEGTLEPAEFSIPTSTNSRVLMLLWADYDNDGDQDLLITKENGQVELWNNNGEFIFTNVAEQAGLVTGNWYHAGAAFADYDHDGWLDLYITKYYSSLWNPIENRTNILYRNNGNGTFTDVTVSAGVFVEPSVTFQPVFFDYNQDGWEDLYLINELIEHTNHLFENNGDGTFTEVSEASGAGVNIEAMSGTVGDFDNDLDLDILVTNRPGAGGLNFLVNEDGDFSNQAEVFGFGTDYSCWGATWLDYDNDGWQDAFVAVPDINQTLVGNEFFVNNQGNSFHNGRDSLGFADDFSRTFVVARGDLNNDGYYDLVHGSNPQTPAKLFRNAGGTNHFISVSLEGTLANKDGIGSWIYCYTPSGATTYYTMCGENLMGQNSKKQMFGLGTETTIDSLVVNWNSGTHEVLTDLSIDEHYHIVEGTSLSQPFTIGYTGEPFLCPGESIELDAGAFESYFWNTGQTTQTIVVTEPGTYSVDVINAFGFEISSIPLVVEVAPETVLTIAATDISCTGASDGAISVDLEGATIDSMLWNTGDFVPVLNNLDAGVYSFSGSDNYGCPFSGGAAIEEPSPLLGQVSTVNTLCYGQANGSAAVNVIGGTPPYLVDWDGLNQGSLPAGDYAVVATDANGCDISFTFSIGQPDSLWASFDVNHASNGLANGSATIAIFGGTPPFTVLWSNGVSDTAIVDLGPGIYNAMVTDAQGCSWEQEFAVETNTGYQDRVSAAVPIVYPNPSNGWLSIANCESATVIYRVFDTAGRIVHSQSTAPCPGQLNFGHLAGGSYILELSGAGQVFRQRLLLGR